MADNNNNEIPTKNDSNQNNNKNETTTSTSSPPSSAMQTNTTTQQQQQQNQQNTQNTNENREILTKLSPKVLHAYEQLARERANIASPYELTAKPISGVGENCYGLIMQVCVRAKHAVNNNESSGNTAECLTAETDVGAKQLHEFITILKMSPKNPAFRDHSHIPELYQREVFLYERVFREYQTLYAEQKQKSGENQQFKFDIVPEIFYTCLDPMDEFFICEDLSLSGHRQNVRTQMPTIDLASATFRAIAKFHAMSFALQSKKPEIFKDLISNYQDNLFNENICYVPPASALWCCGRSPSWFWFLFYASGCIKQAYNLLCSFPGSLFRDLVHQDKAEPGYHGSRELVLWRRLLGPQFCVVVVAVAVKDGLTSPLLFAEEARSPSWFWFLFYASGCIKQAYNLLCSFPGSLFRDLVHQDKAEPGYHGSRELVLWRRLLGPQFCVVVVAVAVKDGLTSPLLFAEEAMPTTQHIDPITIEFARKYLRKTRVMLEQDGRVTAAKQIEALKKLEEHFKIVSMQCVNGPQAAPYAVICHGDYWNNNMLYKYDDHTQEAVSAKLIDFQLSRYSSPVVDLMHYLCTSTDRDLRKQHFKELLDIYYQTLREHLEYYQLDVGVVYPREIFLQHLKEIGIFGLCMAAFSIPFFISNSNELPDMDEVATAIRDISSSSENSDEDEVGGGDQEMNDIDKTTAKAADAKRKELLDEYDLLTERTLPIFKRRMFGLLKDLEEYGMLECVLKL
ncbi:uncharacterized protein LOC101896865 [Musca domestica]|uniref:Uncharacterized protein LOC101896865 n=1 Tax=Musca domestica TaxID=7370 RepID=A0ABM3UU75_MUSDO|nr:uncharacterized protein LOC101896865 [Musca domestica]